MNPKWAKAFKWEEGIFPGSEVLRNLQCRKTHLVKGKLESLTWLSICEMCWVVLTVWSLKCRSHWTKTFLLSRCHVIWDLIPECLGIAGPFCGCLSTNIPGKPNWILRFRMNVNHAKQVLCKSRELCQYHLFPSFQCRKKELDAKKPLYG